MRLLQRSAQVVKLCIAKGGGQEQDLLDSAPPAIVYTLELARKGQPLGITIASAGGILDPIVISQLAPGGLAERLANHSSQQQSFRLQNRGSARG